MSSTATSAARRSSSSPAVDRRHHRPRGRRPSPSNRTAPSPPHSAVGPELPLAFLVDDGETRVLHLGDTAIFGDLRPFSDLYDPDVVLVGVGQARAYDTEPVGRNVAELTIEEAVLVSTWFDGVVVPMHYLPPEREAFVEAMATAEDAPPVRPLDPGGALVV